MVFGAQTETIINVRGNVKDAENRINKLSKALNKLKTVSVSSTGVMTKSYTSGLKGMEGATRKVITGIRRFQMHLLSIMFGGMMLQRIFGRIMRTSVETFKKVVESSGITGTAIHKLSAGFTFLKFVIGDAINTALMPLLPYFMKILMWAVEFISAHPEAVFYTIAGILTAGTFLAAVGSVGLFFQGLSTWAASAGLKSWFGAGGVLAKWALTGVGIAFFLKGLKDFKKNALAGFGEMLMGLGTIAGVWKLVKPTTAGAIILVGFSFKFIADPKFARSVGKWFGEFVGFIGKVGLLISQIIVKAITLQDIDIVAELEKVGLKKSMSEFVIGFAEGLKPAYDDMAKSVTESNKAMEEQELSLSKVILKLTGTGGLYWALVKVIGKSPGLTMLIMMMKVTFVEAGNILITKIQEIVLAFEAEINVIDRLIAALERLNALRGHGGGGGPGGGGEGIGQFGVSRGTFMNVEGGGAGGHIFNITINAGGGGADLAGVLEREIRQRLNTIPI